MSNIISSFERKEKKYLLSVSEAERFLKQIRSNLTEDIYGLQTLCNIYYDTAGFDAIHYSVEKPNHIYKEKFRLRSYGVPCPEDPVFAEIKKKYDGVVYKRRVTGTEDEILRLLAEGEMFDTNPQIQKEILWFFHRYHPIPRAFVGYERIAYLGKNDPGLRVTFDRNLRYRTDHLKLSEGMAGKPIIPKDQCIMEIKFPGVCPLWMARALSKNKIYPHSFSKIGTAFTEHIL